MGIGAGSGDRVGRDRTAYAVTLPEAWSYRLRGYASCGVVVPLTRLRFRRRGRTADAVTLPGVRKPNRVSDGDRAPSGKARGILELANVFHDRVEVGFPSHQAHASAPRPLSSMPWPATIFGLMRVERATGPRLELLHDLSRCAIWSRHHGVDMLHSATDGMEAPAATPADRCNGDFHGPTVGARQRDCRRLQAPGDRSPEAVRWSPVVATRIRPAPFIASKPRSVGRPREEERQRIGADDRSRFGSHAMSVRAYTFGCKPMRPVGRDRTAYAVTLPEAWSYRLRGYAYGGQEAQSRKRWDRGGVRRSRWPRSYRLRGYAS
jgi:hypothetical protein